MKLFVLLALFALPVLAFDLTIENSFPVGKSRQVYRGREPKNKVEELSRLGITDVIIYKNETKDEVQTEIENLKSLGIRSHHIPFRWKEYPSYVEACEQTVEALNIIFRVKSKQ